MVQEAAPQAAEVAPVTDNGTPAGEPTPEVTLESLQAEIATRDAALAERNALLEAERRGSAAKDRALQRTREERDRYAQDSTAARAQAERDARRAQYAAAAEDPEKADALVKAELDRINNPAPVDANAIANERLIAANMATHMAHKTRLAITDAEESLAYQAALSWATDDGRDRPSFEEMLTAESHVAAQRATAPLAEQLRTAKEELEALKAGDAGARMRAAGGPEDRVPSNGAGSRYTSLAEVEAAFANKTFTGTVAELKRLRKSFEPAQRRI